MKKPLVLVELNEINFDIVKKYIDSGENFPSFAKLLANGGARYSSEDAYDQLEPWVQWVSIHTGLTYEQHKVFRLGDIVENTSEQIFESVESQGFKVGAVSPMNAVNRLRRPAYFIPDPWTRTVSDPSLLSRGLAAALAQTINDNAQSRITVSSLIALIYALVRCAPLRHYTSYVALAAGSIRKRWYRAMFLDLLIHDVHWTLFKKRRPDFSTVFFNAGAHIQHHYLFNSTVLKQGRASENPQWYVSEDSDPLRDLLYLYDNIIRDIIEDEAVEYLIATGLTQKPYNKVKFYYRLRNHKDFLKALGLQCVAVHARMTRDFLIELGTVDAAIEAERRLGSVVHASDGVRIFGEIDNRGTSLFVTLTYPDEILPHEVALSEVGEIPLYDFVTFVAIKNGMHDATCFVFGSSMVKRQLPDDGGHVASLFRVIQGYFKKREF